MCVQERREEEKREKKQRKKQERLKRKEQEKIEKEVCICLASGVSDWFVKTARPRVFLSFFFFFFSGQCQLVSVKSDWMV